MQISLAFLPCPVWSGASGLNVANADVVLFRRARKGAVSTADAAAKIKRVRRGYCVAPGPDMALPCLA